MVSVAGAARAAAEAWDDRMRAVRESCLITIESGR
jgi:hypothetical protein